MGTHNIAPKQNRILEKAVVPDKGATAFCYSTGNRCLPDKLYFPYISQHCIKRQAMRKKQRVLPKKHYFRPGLAGMPPALVVRIEGQASPSDFIREVAP